ncbi:hypothetical protein ACFLXA_02700 [Chloroflexota bacterium]
MPKQKYTAEQLDADIWSTIDRMKSLGMSQPGGNIPQMPKPRRFENLRNRVLNTKLPRRM